MSRSRRVREEGRTAASFLAVGVVVAATNLGVFALLLHAGVAYLPAAVAGFVLSTVVSYAGNRRFTFRHGADPTVGHALQYATVQLAGLGVNLLVLTALVEGAGTHALAAELAASALQSTFTFVVHRLWTFRGVAYGAPSTS